MEIRRLEWYGSCFVRNYVEEERIWSICNFGVGRYQHFSLNITYEN